MKCARILSCVVSRLRLFVERCTQFIRQTSGGFIRIRTLHSVHTKRGEFGMYARGISCWLRVKRLMCKLINVSFKRAERRRKKNCFWQTQRVDVLFNVKTQFKYSQESELDCCCSRLKCVDRENCKSIREMSLQLHKFQYLIRQTCYFNVAEKKPFISFCEWKIAQKTALSKPQRIRSNNVNSPVYSVISKQLENSLQVCIFTIENKKAKSHHGEKKESYRWNHETMRKIHIFALDTYQWRMKMRL